MTVPTMTASQLSWLRTSKLMVPSVGSLSAGSGPCKACSLVRQKCPGYWSTSHSSRPQPRSWCGLWYLPTGTQRHIHARMASPQLPPERPYLPVHDTVALSGVVERLRQGEEVLAFFDA